MSYAIKSAADMVVRINNGIARFVECLKDRGFNDHDAHTIYNEYAAMKLLTFDHRGGNVNVKHGGLWDLDVLKNALIMGNERQAKNLNAVTWKDPK